MRDSREFHLEVPAGHDNNTSYRFMEIVDRHKVHSIDIESYCENPQGVSELE